MTELTGTSALIRLILRRDRIALPFWVLLLALVPAATASAFASLYALPLARQAFAATIANSPPQVALLGPVYSASLGGLVAWRVSTSSALLAGLASLLTVIRHTRAEEEAGRRELLGATVIGRHAPLAAALLVTFAANAVMGALIAWGLVGVGLPVPGAVALALGLTGAGWFFAALAGVAAQLTEGAGTARAIAGAGLALAYTLRIVGDGPGKGNGLAWLAWLSPLSWSQRLRPFSGERWELLALTFGVTAVLVAVAFVLTARRDLGAGYFPPRLGPAGAAPGLRHPLALAWRLHRGALVGWVGGVALVSLALGYIASDALEQFSNSPQLAAMFARIAGGGRPIDAFFTFVAALLSQVVAIYAIQATLRLRTEETAMRAEPVLATAVHRLHWAASHLLFALLGPALVLATFGLVVGLSYGSSAGNVGYEVPRVLAVTLAYLPALWVFVGVAMALFGLLPRFTSVSWALLVLCLLIDMFSELQMVGAGVRNLSPFTHVPRLTADGLAIAPLLGLTGVAVGLIVAGLLGFQRRDVG